MAYIQHRSEESVEDYLEVILILSKELPQVRSIDIVHKLDYSKPSVSIAMKNLKQMNLITISEIGCIMLTTEGKKRAETIYERHTLISNWLISLGVDKVVATDDACKIEHDLSTESFAAIKNYILSNQD